MVASIHKATRGTVVTDKQHYIGIDIGGTTITAGVVDDRGRICGKQAIPFPLREGRDPGLERVYSCVDEAVARSGVDWQQVRAIGVAAPGTLDIPAGIVFHPFNLPGWTDLPLRDLVSERFGKPALLQNDANAAAWGEFWVGGAKSASSLMFWTLGTGIGGGIVIDGKLLTGAHSHGAECGHMIVQMNDGEQSPHGIHGALELYAGARRWCRAAVNRRWRTGGRRCCATGSTGERRSTRAHRPRG